MYPWSTLPFNLRTGPPLGLHWIAVVILGSVVVSLGSIVVILGSIVVSLGSVVVILRTGSKRRKNQGESFNVTQNGLKKGRKKGRFFNVMPM